MRYLGRFNVENVMIITELFWISFGAFGIAFEFLGVYRVAFGLLLACVVLRVSVWIVVEVLRSV